MRTILLYVKPYRWPAIIALALMLLELSIELVQPLIMARIIDDGINADNVSLVWRWGAILFILSALAFIAGVVNSYFSAHTAHSFSFDVRNAMFRKIQSFTMATYLRFPSSALITRLTSDVTQVQTVLYMSLRIMLRAPLAVIGSVVMAFVVNAKLAFLLVIGAPILVVFLVLMATKGVRYFAGVQKRLDKVNRVLQESLQAIRLVKAYLRGTYEESRFEQVSQMLKVDTLKVLRMMELIQPALLLVMNLSLLAVLWFGAQQIHTGDTEIGELVAVVNYAMRMTGSFSMFAFLISAFARAKASAERMEEILLIEEGLEVIREHEYQKNRCEISDSLAVGTVRFENVSFCYSASDSVILSQISFEVLKGEKLAIMGATGSGKSTLLSLIPRFYETTNGRVYVNGKDVLGWEIDELRQVIGFVPQQSLLFTGTIEENIRWGNQDASLEELEKATIQAQIFDAVQNFPEGYSTRVGQKGVNLSGGQKQRLSIARALIRHPQILLLDDSTSALDVETEAALWKALEEEQATMLVVTQKIRTAKGADRILLLDEGKIAGYGTHDQLMATSALYRQIVASQQEGRF